MRVLHQGLVDNGLLATVGHSTRADGDLSPSTVDADLLAHRRTAANGQSRWVAPRQVHGADVLVPDSGETSGPSERPEADAVITAEVDLTIAVHTGDCVPIGLVSQGGAVGVVHAGWKGLEAGVLETSTAALRAMAAGPLTAVVGPHIRAARYEFGADDLDRLAARFGSHVVATTTDGTQALDLTAAVTHELERLDTKVTAVSPDCTAALDQDYWSHRARQEAGRIALVAWLSRP